MRLCHRLKTLCTHFPALNLTEQVLPSPPKPVHSKEPRAEQEQRGRKRNFADFADTDHHVVVVRVGASARVVKPENEGAVQALGGKEIDAVKARIRAVDDNACGRAEEETQQSIDTIDGERLQRRVQTTPMPLTCAIQTQLKKLA